MQWELFFSLTDYYYYFKQTMKSKKDLKGRKKKICHVIFCIRHFVAVFELITKIGNGCEMRKAGKGGVRKKKIVRQGKCKGHRGQGVYHKTQEITWYKVQGYRGYREHGI